MNKKILLASILILIIGLFLDQASKLYAVDNFALYESKIVIEDFFSLTLVYNFGAAFGMFDGLGIFFVITAVAMIIFLVLHLYFNRKHINLYLIPTFVFLTGIIGNLIDRIRIGKVIDFFDFQIFFYDFPVFNFADIFITLGAVFFGIALLIEEKRNKNVIKSKK